MLFRRVRRVNVCNYVLNGNIINDWTINSHLIIFTDEAGFHLHGLVATQNNKYWSLDVPDVYTKRHEKFRHDAL